MLSNADKIINLAKSCVGSKFRHQGCSPISGFDCVGLVIYIGNEIGVIGTVKQNYSRRPNQSYFTKRLLSEGVSILAYPQSGCIVRMLSMGYGVHVGIYEVDDMGDEWIIHAHAKNRKVVRQRVTQDVKDEFCQFLRYPD